jgi:hypothetical protein
MLNGKLVLTLLLLQVQVLAVLCRSDSSECPQEAVADSEGPSVAITYPNNGAVISESKWVMTLEFCRFQGLSLSAIVMFGTGQSLNLNSLDKHFNVVITDFENGPYDVSVILLDSNRNPLGAFGEARVSFVVNVSDAADAAVTAALPQGSNFPHRLHATPSARALPLNVLRIALSFSRSIDMKM